MATVMNVDNYKKLPLKERKRIRDEAIRVLYRARYSMNEICAMRNVSKTTVFFAINGRSKKKSGKVSPLK